MYQYIAKLKVGKEVVAEAHTMEELENLVLHYRRAQKKGEHTKGNEEIELIHVRRNKLWGKRKAKEKIVKII